MAFEEEALLQVVYNRNLVTIKYFGSALLSQHFRNDTREGKNNKHAQ